MVPLYILMNRYISSNCVYVSTHTDTLETNLNNVLSACPVAARRDGAGRGRKNNSTHAWASDGALQGVCMCVCMWACWAEQALGPHAVTTLLTYMPLTPPPTPTHLENAEQQEEQRYSQNHQLCSHTHRHEDYSIWASYTSEHMLVVRRPLLQEIKLLN